MGSLGSSSVNELMKSALKDVNDDLQFFVCLRKRQFSRFELI